MVTNDGEGRGERAVSTDKKPAKKGVADLSRALRTVYDDTLREDVPDDFMDLLKKLS